MPSDEQGEEATRGDFVKTVCKLSNPHSFRPTVEQHPELLEAFEVALNLLKDSGASFDGFYAEPSDLLAALQCYREPGRKKKNLKVEFLLIGPDLYSRIIALIEAETKKDKRTITALAESLYNTINKNEFPLSYVWVAACLASNIGVMYKIDKSYDLHQMVALYEEIITMTDDELVLLNAHTNLMRFYSHHQDWSSPEQGDDKAFEHGTSLLKLMEINPKLELEHADQGVNKVTILESVIAASLRKAYRHEFDRGISVISLQKAAEFNDMLLSALKEQKASRGWFASIWKRRESDEKDKELTEALEAKVMIDRALEEQRKRMT